MGMDQLKFILHTDSVFRWLQLIWDENIGSNLANNFSNYIQNI